MPQDDIIRLVYRTASKTFYATMNEKRANLPARQILFLERLQDFSSFRLVDSHKNMYTTLDWEDVRTLTWRGQPVIQRANPGSTTKPEDIAFFCETIDMGMGFLGNTSGNSS